MRRGVHPETSCVCSCPTSCRASRACRAGRQQQRGISTLFPARHGFPYVGRMSGMSGAPGFMGHHAGRMEGHGPDVARGRHGRRAPHRTAFPLAIGLSGRLRPACGLHAGQVRRLGCVGASILKHRAFEIARHHVGQVGHVGQAANNSEAYQRFFLPDMAFLMSGACRACRARPTSWGIMRGGWTERTKKRT